jgi:hypothetical protein
MADFDTWDITVLAKLAREQRQLITAQQDLIKELQVDKRDLLNEIRRIFKGQAHDARSKD